MSSDEKHPGVDTPAIEHGIFATFALRYRQAGLWARPVRLGTKRPPMKEWERPDPEWTLGELNGWTDRYGHMGLGVVTGSPFPDGTKLAALDIDHDDYARAAAALLRNPVSARFGAKGIAIFARLRGDGRYRDFKMKSADGSKGQKVGELLCEKRFCVLPPTIHPDTNQPYRWIGTPLNEVSYLDLPIIEVGQ